MMMLRIMIHKLVAIFVLNIFLNLHRYLYYLYHVALKPRYGLGILEFTVCPSGTEVDKLIKAASDLLHTSNHNAVLVMFPVHYPGLTCEAKLKNTRLIEDRLLFYSCDIGMEIAIHYNVDNMHISEKRPLSQRALLVVSAKISSTSPWKDSELARGKVMVWPLVLACFLKVRG